MSRSRVLHVVPQWLKLTEQFVHAQISRSARPGVVVSREPIVNRETFPYPRLLTLDPLLRLLPSDRARQRAVRGALTTIGAASRAAIVHVHFGYFAHEVDTATRRLRVPFVLSLFGHDATGMVHDHPGHRYDVAFAAADAVVVPSRFLGDRAVEAGARPDAIRVAALGVDTGFFTPTPLPDSPVVAFVGRFVEKKGLDTLLDAWPSVRASVPEARLSMLGFGPLESLARSLGDGTDVTICHTREQVRDALRAARVVAAPSRTAANQDAESELLVNLEAQASGRPVVTTRHGGVPEFVDEGRTGLLVPESDPEALAGAIVQVLADGELAARLGAAGPSWAAAFGLDRCAARVDRVYDELAGPVR